MRNRLLLSVGLIGLFVGAANAADTKILINCFYPPKHPICSQVLPEWKEQVEKVTEKRVRVHIASTSLSPPAEQLQSVRSGLFDAAYFFFGFTENEISGPLVAMNPFISSYSSEVNSIALWDTYQEKLADVDEFDGVKPLAMFVMPGSSIFSLKSQAIKSLDDVLSFKLYGSPGMPANLLKNAGGAVVSGPAVQMTELAQRGVIDGIFSLAIGTMHNLGMLSYVKSVTTTPVPLFSPSFGFVISDKKWAEIKQADQEAIMGISGQWLSALSGRKFDEVQREAVDFVETDPKVAMIEASEELFSSLKEIAEPFTQKWVKQASQKGIAAGEALEFYRERIDSLMEQ